MIHETYDNSFLPDSKDQIVLQYVLSTMIMGQDNNDNLEMSTINPQDRFHYQE